ncbi:MAG: MFS transporter [candidate division Zixibacteria bacterium]|nr:MFS transporter [candidate division Zixibacteria bacterium]
MSRPDDDNAPILLTTRNINGYYTFHLFNNMAFWLPIYALFFLARKLDFSIILYLYAIDTVFQTLLEVPSGVIADRIGRRPVLMLGALAQAAGYLMIAFGGGIPLYVVGMALHGIAMAFVSGADSAFIYDTLAAAGRENEFTQIEGRAYMYNLFAWGAAGLLGGFVAAQSLTAPFVLSAVTSLLAFFVMGTCIEPPRRMIRSSTRQLAAEAIGVVRRNPRVRAIIIFSSILFGLLLVGHKFSQPYLQMTGIDLKLFGVIYFVWLMFAAVSSNYSDRIEKRLGRMVYFLMLPLLAGLPFLYWGWRQSLFGVVVALTHQFVWGSLRPQMAGLINAEVAASVRATALSMAGLGSSLVYVLAALLLGGVADHQGLPAAMSYLGGALIAAGLTAVIPLIRRGHIAAAEKTRLNLPL